MATRIDALSKAIVSAVSAYSSEIETESQAAAKIVAKDTAQLLRQSAPKRKGNYAKSWTYKNSGRDGAIVYARSPGSRLTHLLENPHRIKSKAGSRLSQPQKHIEPAEVTAIDQFEKELVRRLSQ